MTAGEMLAEAARLRAETRATLRDAAYLEGLAAHARECAERDRREVQRIHSTPVTPQQLVALSMLGERLAAASHGAYPSRWHAIELD